MVFPLFHGHPPLNLNSLGSVTECTVRKKAPRWGTCFGSAEVSHISYGFPWIAIWHVDQPRVITAFLNLGSLWGAKP